MMNAWDLMKQKPANSEEVFSIMAERFPGLKAGTMTREQWDATITMLGLHMVYGGMIQIEKLEIAVPSPMWANMKRSAYEDLIDVARSYAEGMSGKTGSSGATP